MPPCRLVHTTAPQPGAIAILQLIGDSTGIMRTLTGINDWPIGRARLASFDDIDEGLAGRPAPDITQLMPHGGPRVVSRLTRRLIQLGAQPSQADVDPETLYPEAVDRYEAIALAAVARAHSPLAIDLLLDQPRRWRAQPALSDSDLARSGRLNRLIDPPIVVVAGPANVGKSTLSNALLGRSMSIALDLPGTTRDYTTGRVELAGLVADWYDTPGTPGTPGTP
ncbi:MAG: GTPase, partial [Planctomycetota bacterium]